MDAAGYLEQSRVTDPGRWRPALELQSADVAWLRGLVPGLVIHAGMGDLYGADLSARVGEARLRTVSGMLERLLQLDPRPLMTARNPGTRLVGNCRQSSVLYCAMLRLARVPARVRAGFSAYFTSPIRGDHWVTERWDIGHWVLADPELGERLVAKNGIDFDPDDLPRDRFILAGQAWLACRAGDEDADRYGLNPRVTGLGYIRAQLLRDLAALTGLRWGPGTCGPTVWIRSSWTPFRAPRRTARRARLRRFGWRMQSSGRHTGSPSTRRRRPPGRPARKARPRARRPTPGAGRLA